MRLTLTVIGWLLFDLADAITGGRLGRIQRARRDEERRVLLGFDLLRDEPDILPEAEAVPVEDLQRERRLDLDIDTAYHARAEQWLADIVACAEMERRMYADDRELRAWTLPLDMLPPRRPGASLLPRRVPGKALVGCDLPEVEYIEPSDETVERVHAALVGAA